MKPTIIYLLSLVILWGCSPQKTEDQSLPESSVFKHGVASGDPLNDRIIIWTRVTPVDPNAPVEVDWEFATDAAFNSILKYGKYTTVSDRDFTVKVDVSGLNPGTKYYYRFKALGETSVTGKTKTAALYADSLVFAVVSCSNWEWGYFNAYGRIADRENLDAVIHLGDYIYEYGIGSGDTTIGRYNDPPHEIITLDDYRTRYSLYRKDKDLMSVHANHPFIVIWDDHEIANNSYKTGAQNHQEDEGSYETRKAIARKVYYEWMPIREGEKLYRKFSFGQLAEVFMLDERLEGRSMQLENIEDPEYQSTDRSMLGEGQLEWLKTNLSTTESTWKIIGNQVIFTDLDRSLVFPNRPRNMDSWDGYPAEKRDIASSIVENKIHDVIWITGDTHSSWAFNTIVEGVSDKPFAVEFGVTSVSSSNYDERVSIDTVRMAEELYIKGNPHLKYSNLSEHGYLLLTLSSSRAMAEYYFVDTVRKPSENESLGFKCMVNSGVPSIKEFN
ncbi:MAG: alkaline phosphatase D family protein [Bacteroidota bacterium]